MIKKLLRWGLIAFAGLFVFSLAVSPFLPTEQERLERLKVNDPEAYAQEMLEIERRVEAEKQRLQDADVQRQQEERAEQQRITEEETVEFMSRLEGAQLGLKTYFGNKSMCRMNLTIMQTCLKTLNEATQVLLDAEGYQLSAEQQQALKALRKNLVTKQKTGLSNMRDAFGPVVRKMLWEVDITAKTVGTGYRTIKLTGGWFAVNRNIKQVQEDMSPMLNRLRFKRAEYRWSDIADKYQYYELETPNDGELVVWQGTTNRYVVVE